MKRNGLIILLTLFTITLFGQAIEEKAESQSYKHDKGTIFAIKQGSKFHAFENGEQPR